MAYHKLITEDRLNYARKVLRIPDEWIWDAVKQIINSVFDHKQTAVKSGHSLSKDYTAGILVHQWLNTYYPAKVIVTAPTGRQVKDVMFMEIAKQFERVKENSPFPVKPDWLTATKLEILPELVCLGFTTKETHQKIGKMSGFKSPNLLVIVSEAQAVDDAIYDQLIGIMTSSNARILELGNPLSEQGRFWEHCTKERYGYNVISLSCLDSPNYKARKEIIPGVVTYEWVEKQRQTWGEEHPYWFGHVLGEFPQDAADSIIPISWIMKQVRDEKYYPGFFENIQDNDDLRIAGLDIAGQGHDETAMVVLTGCKVTTLKGFHKMRLNEVVGWAIETARENQLKVLAFDSGGLADVGSFLRDETYMTTLAFNFGAKLEDNANFENLSARAWWELRLAFERHEIFIPDDPILIGQLASRRFTWTQKGKKVIRMESKLTAKQRGVESPDRADALVMAWWGRHRYLKMDPEMQGQYESAGSRANNEMYKSDEHADDGVHHNLTLESEKFDLI